MTLKDIAEMAGVSVASVSNVINGNFHKVSDETRRKIEKIIEDTNYKPNIMARSLAKQESRIISLVIPYIGPGETFQTNPYYSYLIAEIERYLRSRDYYLMIRCVGLCKDILPVLSSWKVDGAIFTGASREEIKEIRERLGCPMVFLDTYCDEKGVVNVGIHDYRGGYLAARHLLRLGHRSIAFVAPPFGSEGVIYERFRGFNDACVEYGVTIEKEDIFEANTDEFTSAAAGQDIAFSKKKYTAVAAMSDVTACGIIEGLHQCGLNVPDDFSVIGFDNLPMSAYYLPKLSTVAQDISQKAAIAAEHLLKMIENKKPLTLTERLPVELVERESTGKIEN